MYFTTFPVQKVCCRTSVLYKLYRLFDVLAAVALFGHVYAGLDLCKEVRSKIIAYSPSGSIFGWDCERS